MLRSTTLPKSTTCFTAASTFSVCSWSRLCPSSTGVIIRDHERVAAKQQPHGTRLCSHAVLHSPTAITVSVSCRFAERHKCKVNRIGVALHKFLAHLCSIQQEGACGELGTKCINRVRRLHRFPSSTVISAMKTMRSWRKECSCVLVVMRTTHQGM